jgi:hypothetical protein
LTAFFAFFASRLALSDLPTFFVLCFCGDLSGMAPLFVSGGWMQSGLIGAVAVGDAVCAPVAS